MRPRFVVFASPLKAPGLRFTKTERDSTILPLKQGGFLDASRLFFWEWDKRKYYTLTYHTFPSTFRQLWTSQK